MPRITQEIVLKHRLVKTDEPAEVRLAAGDEVEVIKEWANHYLIRTADKKVFNIPREYVDPA